MSRKPDLAVRIAELDQALEEAKARARVDATTIEALNAQIAQMQKVDADRIARDRFAIAWGHAESFQRNAGPTWQVTTAISHLNWHFAEPELREAMIHRHVVRALEQIDALAKREGIRTC